MDINKKARGLAPGFGLFDGLCVQRMSVIAARPIARGPRRSWYNNMRRVGTQQTSMSRYVSSYGQKVNQSPTTSPSGQLLGAPRAGPPERSGDRGAPRVKAKGVPGGEAPRI